MIKSLRAKFGLLVLPLAAAVLLFASFGATGVFGLHGSLRDLRSSYRQMRASIDFARFAHFELGRRLADEVLPGDTFDEASDRFGARADSALGVWRDSIAATGDTAELRRHRELVVRYENLRTEARAAGDRAEAGALEPELRERERRIERMLVDSVRPVLSALLEEQENEVLDALTRMERNIGQSSPWVRDSWFRQTQEATRQALQVIQASSLLRTVSSENAEVLMAFHVPVAGPQARLKEERRRAAIALDAWRAHIEAEGTEDTTTEREVLDRIEETYMRTASVADQILELLGQDRPREAAELLEHVYADTVANELEPLLNEVVERDEIELQASVAGVERIGDLLMWGTGGASLLLLVFGLTLPMLLARDLIHRLIALTRAAARFAAGERTAVVPVRSADEIGLLERGFNAMASTIQEQERSLVERAADLERANDELERRVEERTAELAEREELSRMLIENAGDEVLVIGEDGRLVNVNQRACEMLGYDRESLLGRPVVELLTDGSDMLGPSTRALAAGRVATWVGDQRRRDGGIVPTEARIGPVALRGRRLYVAVARDVTEQRRIQEALRSARDAAIEASRLKSDFLANMSHEIRTPLNGVVGMTSLLLDSDLNPRQREDAEAIRRSAENLLTIINDILDLSRIEAGKLTLEPAPFEVERVVDEVAGLLAAAAEQKGIDLIVRIAPDTPEWLVGDVTRLRQILTNLAGNAVKFTSRGHVMIDLSVLRRDENGVLLSVAVEDTGIGIPQHRADKVFEKFEQSDRSIQKRFGGTGLGLAISRQLVDAMGGEIGVTSAVGKGSRFWLKVPLPIAAADERPAEPRRAALAGLRVLVVDDNEVNRRVLMEQFQSWGLRPDEAAAPGEALARARAAAAQGDRYRLLVLDYDMPEMNGDELAAAARREPALGSPIAVVLSSVGRRPAAEANGASAVAAWLVKPVRPSALLDALAGVWAPGEVPSTPTRRTSPALRVDARVLLAEDNVINQKVARRMLEKLGCTVNVVADGREAVAAVQEGRYDVVFMDCQMPNVDGFEATRRIRAGEGQDRHTPIVALTADAMAGDRERCLAAGMDDYLPKPVREEDLVRALERSLGLPVGEERA